MQVQIWPVYQVWFAVVAPQKKGEKPKQLFESLFVEDDPAMESGRLMSPDTFPKDPIVGTKYGSRCTILRKLPTFQGKRLIGHIPHDDVLQLDAVFRTVAMLEKQRLRSMNSAQWLLVALREAELCGVLAVHQMQPRV